MLPYFREGYGNANSIHGHGNRARQAVETARTRIAGLILADDPSQIFFTSGATESNNWLARSTSNGLYSPFEHSSLEEAALRNGWALWPNHGVELRSPGGNFEIASLMAVNNEVGTIWDVREQSVSAEKLHADATQIVGKLPFSVANLDFASMSAHKLYGPKGVGALYCAESPPTPYLVGGEQEQGFRSGTLNVPGIVGFGAAALIAQEEIEENAAKVVGLRALFLDRFASVSDWVLQGGPKTSPFILGISVLGVEGETLVIEADHRGYAISSGAACSSHSNEPSHVLRALGIDDSVTRGTIRISFGRHNNEESTEGLSQTLAHSIEMLRTMTGGH